MVQLKFPDSHCIVSDHTRIKTKAVFPQVMHDCSCTRWRRIVCSTMLHFRLGKGEVNILRHTPTQWGATKQNTPQCTTEDDVFFSFVQVCVSRAKAGNFLLQPNGAGWTFTITRVFFQASFMVHDLVWVRAHWAWLYLDGLGNFPSVWNLCSYTKTITYFWGKKFYQSDTNRFKYSWNIYSFHHLLGNKEPNSILVRKETHYSR